MDTTATKIARALGLTNPDVIASLVAEVEDARDAGSAFITLRHGGRSLLLNLAHVA